MTFIAKLGRVHWALLFTACGSLSESDPQFWATASDLGGKRYEFGGPPPSAGGLPVDTGGSIGSGGTVSVDPTSTGSVAPPPPPATGGSGGLENTGGSLATGGTVPPDPTGTQTAPPPPPPTGNPEPCSFTFTVTTVTARGRYAPRNVGAVWITDAQGKFVKALEVWGQIRLNNATAWVQASAGARVDVVTAATRPSHGAHTLTWDCTDPAKNPVPFGTYQVHVTFAESDAFPFFGPAPIQTSASFERNGSKVESDGTSATNFTSMHVSIE